MTLYAIKRDGVKHDSHWPRHWPLFANFYVFDDRNRWINEYNFSSPDLIAVSSTVIPLAEYQASNSNETHHNHHPSPYSDEYKLAYMKHVHVHKKAHADDVKPDTLITREYIWLTFEFECWNWIRIIVYFSAWKECDQGEGRWSMKIHRFTNKNGRSWAFRNTTSNAIFLELEEIRQSLCNKATYTQFE